MRPSEKLTVEDILDFEENNRKECNHNDWQYLRIERYKDYEGNLIVWEVYKCMICEEIKYVLSDDIPF